MYNYFEHKAHLSEIQQKFTWKFWKKEQKYYIKKRSELKKLIKIGEKFYENNHI